MRRRLLCKNRAPCLPKFLARSFNPTARQSHLAAVSFEPLALRRRLNRSFQSHHDQGDRMAARTTSNGSVLTVHRNERVSAPAAAAILGTPLRTVQAMAKRGAFPGAALIFGRWTFNEAALRAWLLEQEKATCRSAEPLRAVTGGAIRYGAALSLRGGSIDGAYERGIRKLRNLVTTPKKRA